MAILNVRIVRGASVCVCAHIRMFDERKHDNHDKLAQSQMIKRYCSADIELMWKIKRIYCNFLTAY